MKKFFSFLIAALMALPIFAVSPFMNYQAVINHPDGTPAANREIGLKFSILADGIVEYTEEATVTADNQGLVEWPIGNNSNLATLDWASRDLKLEVGIDLNGGTNYTSVYTSAIQTVPTAFYAVRSGDSYELHDNINMLYNLVYENKALIENIESIIDSLKPEDGNVNTADLEAKIQSLQALIEENSARITEVYNLNLDSFKDLQIFTEEQIKEVITKVDATQLLLEAELSNLQALINVKITSLEELVATGQIDLSKLYDTVKGLTEDYSAALKDQLETQKKELNDAIANIETYLADHSAKIDYLQVFVSVQEQEINNLKQENASIKNDINMLINIIDNLQKKVDELSNNQ